MFTFNGLSKVEVAPLGVVNIGEVSFALYITAAYWFTSSTSFANPAITVARSLSDSFAGIAHADVAGFVVAQLAGALLALGVSRVLFAGEAECI